MTDIFADGAADITVINGVVRINLVTLEPDPANRDKGEPRMVPTTQHRLVMPLPGFVNALAQGQALVAKLEQAGVLQRGGADAAKDPGRPTTPPKAPPTSPNF
ncbi:MAG: hypothetical protein FJX57_02850 [Alphaproteobacteria bacterium]|nr:hypothetical protein [Alphaproteobacteria bacterium]